MQPHQSAALGTKTSLDTCTRDPSLIKSLSETSRRRRSTVFLDRFLPACTEPGNIDAAANIILLVALLCIITQLVCTILMSALDAPCPVKYGEWITFSIQFIVIAGMTASKYFNRWWDLKDFLSPLICLSVALSLFSATVILNQRDCGALLTISAVANGVMCIALLLALVLIYGIQLGIIDRYKAFPPIVSQAYVMARNAGGLAGPGALERKALYSPAVQWSYVMESKPTRDQPPYLYVIPSATRLSGSGSERVYGGGSTGWHAGHTMTSLASSDRSRFFHLNKEFASTMVDGLQPFVARALYSYVPSPRDINEMAFQKDDILLIVDARGLWWQAAKPEGGVALVPSNFLERASFQSSS